MAEKLKPCPFCGGDASVIIVRHEAIDRHYAMSAVGCASCKIHRGAFEHMRWEQGKGHFNVYKEGLAASVKAWNTRAK